MYIGIATNNLTEAQTYMDALALKLIGAKLYNTNNKHLRYVIIFDQFNHIYERVEDLYMYLEKRTNKKIHCLPNDLHTLELHTCIRTCPTRLVS